MSDAALLAVVALRKAFGGLVAVDDLSFAIARGTIVGLIGPNGSGKTTALNLISGALAPDAGEIRFRDRAIAALSADRIARLGVARTFQLVRVLDSLTCAENVMAPLAFRAHPLWGEPARRSALALLERVGLGGKAELMPGQLTYVDQKRLELARALALDPELLLLDEWLAGLNPSELRDGIALVRLVARAGPDHHPGRACDARHPLAQRPLRRDECRPQDRRGTAASRARRPRGCPGLPRRRRCLRLPD